MSAHKTVQSIQFNQDSSSQVNPTLTCTTEAFEYKYTYYNVVINEITMFDKNDLKLKKIFWGQLIVSNSVLYFQISKYNYGFCL